MSAKQRICKITLGPSDPITRKNSCAGLVVIADYLDPITSQRTLVMERPETPAPKAAAPAKPKPRAKRAAAAKTNAAPVQPSSATAFPGSEAVSG